jgi:hypothetical protein
VERAGRASALPAASRSVLVRHLQNLLPRVLADEIRVIGGDVRLDVLDQRIVGLTLDVRATRAVDDLHLSLLDCWTNETLLRRRPSALEDRKGAKVDKQQLARHAGVPSVRESP